MSDSDRFSKLEPKNNLPARLQTALSRLPRFESLEIATATSIEPSSKISRILCAHCGQWNERSREVCWACCKPLSTLPRPPEPTQDQPIDLIVDGVSYHSSDPHMPEDIRELMNRIRKHGYSKELLAEWQAWRREQRDALPSIPQGKFKSVEVFPGQRVSILRIDGVLYKSDDLNLPPEVKELFDYIEAEGLSPALLQHLRLYGTLVKYRPPSTPIPSDGDHDFWHAAKKAFHND